MGNLVIGGKYQHYKKENYFVEVLGVANHSETLEKFVLYRSLQDSEEYPKGTLWVRPHDMFLETVEVEGKDVPRFRYVGDGGEHLL